MKVAICGAGQMGHAHFITLSEIDRVQVVAVADPASEKLGIYSERGVATFGSAEEMLDKANADIAVIATPTAFHAPLAIRALDRDMHVFCEKPMARTSSEGRKMVAAAEKSGKTLGVGYVLRHHEAYVLARNYICSGRLGNIGTVRTSRSASVAPRWTADIEANGGAAFELLTHDLDWLRWSLGPVRRIFARGLASRGAIVERDYCLAIIRFENGAIAHLEGSLAEADQFFAAYEVAGDAGLLSYDTRKSIVLEARLMTAEGLAASSETPQNERPFTRQVRAFLDAVESGRKYEVDGREGLESLVLTEAVLACIQSGEPVEF